MRITCIAAVATSIAMVASMAASAPTDVKFIGSNAGGYRSVGVSSTVYTDINDTSVNAGAFSMSQTPSNGLGHGIDPAFAAFCLDLTGTVSAGQTYKYEVNNTNPFQTERELEDFQKSNIRAVFDTHYSDEVITDRDKSAAFQLALWAAAYETDDSVDLSVSTGTFIGTSGRTGLVDQANLYLQGFTAFEGDYVATKYKTNFLDAVSIARQDLGTATVIPLPAAGFLLFGAIGALGFTSRRRKAASKA